MTGRRAVSFVLALRFTHVIAILHPTQYVIEVVVRPFCQINTLTRARILDVALAVQVAENADVVGTVVSELVKASFFGHGNRRKSRCGFHGETIVLAEQIELERLVM